MRADRPIWLVGMMGAGKSTVGSALAARLSLPFLDSDAKIERRVGRSIPEIFKHDGEAHFRTIEREFIDEISCSPAVVALGGGAICQPGMLEHVKALGVLVYLRASPESLLARIGDGRSRPLLSGLTRQARRQRIEELLNEREESYARASIIVETDGLRPDAVASRIADELAKLAESGATRESGGGG